MKNLRFVFISSVYCVCPDRFYCQLYLISLIISVVEMLNVVIDIHTCLLLQKVQNIILLETYPFKNIRH